MSTQFSNAPIANTTDLGFLKPDGTTTLVAGDGTLSITIPSGTIVRSGTVTIGDVGGGTTGGIPCDGDFATASKSNPDVDTTVVDVTFTTPLPIGTYFLVHNPAGTNTNTTIVATATAGVTTTGFRIAARQFTSLVQSLVVDITVIAYAP